MDGVEFAVEGEAALPSGVGGSNRLGVPRPLVVYGGALRVADVDAEMEASLLRVGAAVAATAEPEGAGPDVGATCEEDEAAAVGAALGDGDGRCKGRVESDAMAVAANVGDAGGDARSMGLARVPRLVEA